MSLARLLVMMASRSGVNVEYLVVGAGAAGADGAVVGTYVGAGGGAGEVLFGSLGVQAGDSIAVTVGTGGAAVPNDDGLQGGSSSFGDVFANGGHGAGRSDNVSNASPGHGGSGCGGGGGGFGAGSGTPGTGGVGTTSSGSDGDLNGGFGGGAGGSATGLAAGAGIPSSIAGSSVYYGSGGGSVDPVAPGRGGDGSGIFTSTQDGEDGIVYVRYPTGSLNAIGGTKSVVGGYTLHTFHSDGAFTVIS